MTDPNGQQTNPPNPQPPHASNQPDNSQQQQASRPPVVVQSGPDNSELNNRMSSIEQTLRGLPETFVNAFREATQPAQQPASQQGQVQQVHQNGNQGGSGAQQPGTNQNPSAPPPPGNMEQQTTAGTGVKGPSRVAKWFFGRQ